MTSALLQVTARLPRVSMDTLFAAAEGARALWEPRDGGRALAGVGVAHQIVGRGRERFAQVGASAEALFAAIEDIREPGCEDAPPSLLLGGLAFAPREAWTSPWRAFGDASFVLPRWLLIADRDAAYLRVVVPAAEGLAGARALVAGMAARLRAQTPHPDPVPVPGRGGARAASPSPLQEESSDRSARAESPSPPQGERGGGEGAARVEHMGAGTWREMVVDALRRIDARELDKLVAARCSVVRADAPIDLGAMLARLRGPAQPGVLFAHERGDATFLGLSPERLVARAGADVRADALAGTGAEPAVLAASAKDLHEHALVVDGIRRALEPVCATLDAPATPLVRALPGLCHLWTPVTATLARPVHVLELVGRLHPTPAVAGTPAAAAVEWIAAHEPVPRGWYAGPVGWFDARGDGDFAVAIRSAVVEGATAWLWAGAGIVPASDPDREYGETQVKQRALLGALGVTA